MSKTLADYPNLLKQWHPTKNGEIKPEGISFSSHKKIWWKCPIAEDHEWEASPNHRTQGRNCPCCLGKKIVLSNCLATTHPHLTKEWHHKNILTPFEISHGTDKKFWWQCKNKHEWQASCDSRTGPRKRGCPYCMNQKVWLGNCLETLFPEIAKEWHPTENGNITPNDVVAGTNKKFWWQCEKGHKWQASPNTRTNMESGCPYCDNKKVTSENCLETLFPEIAKEWHPVKNRGIFPDNVVANTAKKFWWQCEKGHEWITSCHKRAQGTNCPTCNLSKGEFKIKKFLINKNINFQQQVTFTNCKYKQRLLFDFSISQEDIFFLIEYNGEHHYKSIKRWGGIDKLNIIKIRDTIKLEWCKINNIPLLVIPYWEFDKIELVINDFMNQMQFHHKGLARVKH